MSALLRVGDTVLWRGGFGANPPVPAKVTHIEVSEHRRDNKYGEDAESVPWERIEYACVDLDNGHWAYGEQLSPAPPWPAEIVETAKEIAARDAAYDARTAMLYRQDARP